MEPRNPLAAQSEPAYTGEQASPPNGAPRLMLSPIINQKRILTGLASGFGLVMLLLSIAGLITIQRSQAIQATAATALREHLADATTIDSYQIQQERMGKLLWDLLDTDASQVRLAARVDLLTRDFRAIARTGNSEDGRMADLRAAGLSFTDAARLLLHARPAARETLSRTLEESYERFTALATQVVRRQAASSAELERQIEVQSAKLRNESLWLLGTCLALALAGAIVTITITARSFRLMRWQSEELNRVSWHMLESQESAARRFSHEMHDELGQSLAGLKALVRDMSGTNGRREECLKLLDEAIGNVRELSQLLRPVVLDDFGLDAALRWLAERFEERTRLQVVYESNLHTRLPEQTETHLFRIAQEALTNIARHSGASETRIMVDEQAARVQLVIEDNGRGLSQNTAGSVPSLGMVGMRARARQIGGELNIDKGRTGGVRITVWAPLKLVNAGADQENAHCAGG